MTFLGNKENSEDLYLGIKTWEASTGGTRSRIFDLQGNNSGENTYPVGEFSKAWVVCQSIEEARTRIFIQAFGSGGWEYTNLFKNENLHSVDGIRSLGVYQSFEVLRMRIFILERNRFF